MNEITERIKIWFARKKYNTKLGLLEKNVKKKENILRSKLEIRKMIQELEDLESGLRITEERIKEVELR